MYIQDENQKIIGNLDIPGEWDENYQPSQMSTLVVIIPQIGAYVTYREEEYVILSTVTYQEEADNDGKSVITTLCRISRIDDEGDLMPIEGKTVRATELTLI